MVQNGHPVREATAAPHTPIYTQTGQPDQAERSAHFGHLDQTATLPAIGPDLRKHPIAGDWLRIRPFAQTTGPSTP